MNVTLAVDDQVVMKAREHAETLGTSMNQLVREHLELLAGVSSSEADANEFATVSRRMQGNSQGWKFDRDELHERR